MGGKLIFLVFFLAGFAGVVIYANIFITSKNIEVPIRITPIMTTSQQSDFSLDAAPSESLIGKLVSFEGKVEWQSRVATISSEIQKTIPILQGEKITTETTGKATIEFPGYLIATINPLTEINIIQTLKNNIVLEQKSGSTQFQKTGDVPVSIRALNLLIDNQGQIVINVDDKREIVTINVLDGQVVLAYNNSLFITKVISVGKNKKITYNARFRRYTVR